MWLDAARERGMLKTSVYKTNTSVFFLFYSHFYLFFLWSNISFLSSNVPQDMAQMFMALQPLCVRASAFGYDDRQRTCIACPQFVMTLTFPVISDTQKAWRLLHPGHRHYGPSCSPVIMWSRGELTALTFAQIPDSKWNAAELRHTLFLQWAYLQATFETGQGEMSVLFFFPPSSL